MSQRFILFAASLVMAMVFSVASLTAHAAKVDPNQPPAEFIEAVAQQTLHVVKNDDDAQAGDRSAVESLVDQYVLPYINFEKTTRLATGRHWRQASAEQREGLVNAFKKTLIRTYSGSLSNVNKIDSIRIRPFRGDPEAEDVVVRSSVVQKSGPEVGVDYRMENTPEGWKIYDINVEGIWLIQNYRNQFSQVIQEKGIDGLIDTLNNQSMPADQNA